MLKSIKIDDTAQKFGTLNFVKLEIIFLSHITFTSYYITSNFSLRFMHKLKYRANLELFTQTQFKLMQDILATTTFH